MGKSIKVSVDLDNLEAAAVNMGILARGLGGAFEDSLASMNSKSKEDMQAWFSENYDSLNGSLACISFLSEFIGDALAEVNASQIKE